MLLTGCGHKQTAAKVPPPPEQPPVAAEPPAPTHPAPPSKPSPAVRTNAPPVVSPEPEIIVPKNAKVLYAETGWASWYGPGFQNRRAANGDVYDMNRVTAAHRTIPLNSVVRVTNTKTGESVLLRITDRGPFVSNRIIDLSKAAAQKVGVYQHGTALVKIEVLESPAPVLTGGRWAVQIGTFSDAKEAAQMKDQLSRRYRTATVLQFAGPTGDQWLRVRVADDDKKRAEALVRETHTNAGIYLVRLD